MANILKTALFTVICIHSIAICQCSRELEMCKKDLTHCNRNLGYCDANLGYCNRKLRTCNDELEEYQSELQSVVKTYEETTLRFIVHLAKREEYSEASTELQAVKNYERYIGRVIRLTYNQNVTNVLRVASFIKHLSWCRDMAKGLRMLYNEMRKNGDLLRSEIFLLPWSVSGCPNINDVKDVLETINVHLKKMLSVWATNISSNNFTGIITFIESNSAAAYSFRQVQSDLFNTVLNKVSGKEKHFFEEIVKLLKFVHAVPHTSIQGNGYSVLLNELKSRDREHSEETIAVAYEIHKKWQVSSKLGLNLYNRIYQKLYEEIPTTIRNLFWHTNCSIKNEHFNEYLHATIETRWNQGNGQVFTCAPGYKIPEEEWFLEPYYSSDGRIYFRIKITSEASENVYLCEGMEGRQHWLSMCSGSPSPSSRTNNDLWNLIPSQWRHPETKQLFLIKVNGSSEMFAFPSEEQQMGLKIREVKLGEPMMASFWDVECAPSLSNENNTIHKTIKYS